MQTKVQIRKRIRQIRNEMSLEEVNDKSHLICERLLKLPQLLEAEHILVYAATQNEVCLDEFISEMQAKGKQIYFPRVCKEEMDFYHVNKNEDLKRGYFGILEPDFSCEIFKNSKGVVLVPAVAFSVKGQRIGYGKGFYDRFLCRFPDLETIGIAYDFQIVEDFETNEHDVSMGMIITEKREVVWK